MAAHWDGKAWTNVSDGAGGLWMPVSKGFRTAFVHRSKAGRWTTTKELTGSGSKIGDVALVPGTKTLWAAGCENCSFPGPATPLFLRNGPQPGR
jgi:hypothetical protein